MSQQDIDERVATGEWWVDVMSSVKVTVTDPEHIESAIIPGHDRNQYGFRDVEAVMHHLAYNCVVNGVEDASRLDGWGDLEPGQLTMSYDRLVEYERVVDPDPRPREGANGEV